MARKTFVHNLIPFCRNNVIFSLITYLSVSVCTGTQTLLLSVLCVWMYGGHFVQGAASSVGPSQITPQQPRIEHDQCSTGISSTAIYETEEAQTGYSSQPGCLILQLEKCKNGTVHVSMGLQNYYHASLFHYSEESLVKTINQSSSLTCPQPSMFSEENPLDTMLVKTTTTHHVGLWKSDRAPCK